jgi:hypothetical protein
MAAYAIGSKTSDEMGIIQIKGKNDMKEVTCFQDSNGDLHKTELEAAIAEILSLSKPAGIVTEKIGRDNAAKLIHNRKKVIAVLQQLDMQQARPADYCPPRAQT